MSALEEAFSLFSDDDDGDADEGGRGGSENFAAAAKRSSLLAAVTVGLSVEEEGGSDFARETIERAVACLRTYGLVIFPRLFEGRILRSLSGAALRDLDQFMALAAARGGIGTEGNADAFLELASRHEGRYELRNGREMRNVVGDGESFRQHRGLLAVLREACAAPGHALVEGQPGDEIVARDVGAFVSLPGASNQELHGDNDHLWWHENLPPHVVTMFLPGCLETAGAPAGAAAAPDAVKEDQARVGWTAFVPRTHSISAAAAVLGNPPSSPDDDHRCICPRLEAGDALLYDARLLHFGLANTSTRTRRPLMYVSFVRRWFQDRQNWGSESLLSGGI